MKKKTICDLPHDLVGEKILSKVPITSLREVRSTCKLWDRLSKNWIVGKSVARQHQFLGFMTKDFKVCSLRFHLRRKEEEVNLSIKQVDLLNQIEITKVFHCDGLLLCVGLDNSKLVAWNPYLGQSRSISPRTYFQIADSYLFGYDMNRNHKILRVLANFKYSEFEIYDFSSNSWRVLEVRPDWEVDNHHRGVSLKGNSYFWAHEKMPHGIDEIEIDDQADFLICFDFTTERFGQMSLPFHSSIGDAVTVSSFRDEKLALLHRQGMEKIEELAIWITSKIEPNAVSWSNFINVDMRPLIGDRHIQIDDKYGSFYIDEEEKVVVFFDMDGYEFGYELIKTPHYHTAFIVGDDGYYKTVNLGEAPDLSTPEPGHKGYTPQCYSPPLICSSSYLPSLVQLNQPHKRKQRDEY